MTGQSSASACKIEQLIRDAFAGVTLEDGVGLLQGQAIDDYAGAEAQAAARSEDEKHDWTRIPAHLLNSAHSSLSFFDPKGMRFHLPAYLIADIKGELHQDIVFHLTFVGHDGLSRFSLLNQKQRAAVRQYLLHHLAAIPEPNREFEKPMIDEAIINYWS